MKNQEQKALELFILGDVKYQRTVSIITALLKGEKTQGEIAKDHGISRRAVIDISNKYIK